MLAQSNLFSVAVAQSLPLWRQGQAINEWRQVSASSLSGVTGVSTVGGNTGRHSIVTTWNGTCVNPNNSHVYLVGCGGHTDYAGNEVYVQNLEADSPQWQLDLNTSTNTPDADYYPDGRPSSAHTYFSQVFVPEINRAMRFGNGSRWSNGNDNYYIDGYDPIAKAYDPAGTYPIMGARVNMQAWAVTRDPLTGDVYMAISDGGTERVRRWNRASNTMSTLIASASFYGYYAAAAFDSIRRRVLWMAGSANGNRRYHVADGTWASQAISGVSTATSQAGLIYVEATDSYYWRSAAAGGAVVRIDAGTYAATSLATTGGGSIPSRPNGCYNAFAYCPRLQGAYYVASFTGGTWFVRLH